MATISLIAAVADNGVLGRDGGLPWHLPEDLRHFQRTTMGKPVIMGRKTWDSIGRRPLPGRACIVMSRQADLPCAGAQLAADFDAALQLATRTLVTHPAALVTHPAALVTHPAALVTHPATPDSPPAASAAAESAANGKPPEIMVAGGAAIYTLALPRATRLYLTEVHARPEGDARFPDWNKREWREVRRERHPAGPGASCDCSFVVYERA